MSASNDSDEPSSEVPEVQPDVDAKQSAAPEPFPHFEGVSAASPHFEGVSAASPHFSGTAPAPPERRGWLRRWMAKGGRNKQ
jgi:hypothetical protein